MNAIEVHNACKNYKSVRALANVSFSVEEGEIFGLLGPNGAGKTTLISCLAGLATLSSGKLSVMGFDVVKDYKKARKALGVVPQELVYDPFFTVLETLKLQSGFFGVTNNGAWIEEILHGLNLENKANAPIRMLSGGMKRRVLVAQALVHKPPVVVLDEPTAGVDVELRQSLWQFIQNYQQRGNTIILTTHYLEEAEQMCSRLALLKEGQLLRLTSTTELLKEHAGKSLEEIFIELIRK